MDNLMDTLFRFAIGAIFIVVIGAGIFMVSFAYKMYSDCVAAGNASYVCYSIVNQPTYNVRNLNDEGF